MPSADDYYQDKFPYPEDKVVTLPNGVRCLVGKHTYGIELIQHYTWSSATSFNIGRFCSIAHTKFFLGGNHLTHHIAQGLFLSKYFNSSNSLEEKYSEVWNAQSTNGNITIGNDVWIGNYSTVMSGITIGDGAVIAANAHIVKDVLPYTIVGGNPGREIKHRFDYEIVELLLELKWWEFDDLFINEMLPILKSNPSIPVLKGLIDSTKVLPRTKAF